MLNGIFVILACQLAGEAIVRGIGVPVPGPVVGIGLLFAALAVSERLAAGRHGGASAPEAGVGQVADGLLRHLGLLFVPAGVGIAQSYGLILANGPAILTVLFLSTVATMLATVAVFLAVRRLVERRRARGEQK